jgi:1-hydroxycarotenoid 3,4-desaturase
MQSLFNVKAAPTILDMGETPSVVVVGAGAGGLAVAIDLAAAGCAVTVLESADRAGGKMAGARLAGTDLDAGPTVLTMRWVFEELFQGANRSLDAYVRTEAASLLARHAWPDGSRLDLYADVERSTDAISEAFGAAEARGYQRFCELTRKIYDTVEGPFLRAQRPGLAGALRQAATHGPGVVARIDAMRTMWGAIESTFADARMRQLFGRYATYVGSSPFEAPATFNLVAHVERCGVQLVEGGMRALAEALVVLATELGVTLRFGARVATIALDRGRAARAVLESGESIAADAIVFNGDAAALSTGLLGDQVRGAVKPVRVERRSFSAVTWELVTRAAGFPLAHHNVFFSRDYPAEFEALRAGGVPDEVTAYVCAQDRGKAAAPPGSPRLAASQDESDERLLVVVNAPPTGDGAPWTPEDIERWERATFATLNRSGLSLTPRATRVTTPRDFHLRFPATGGALYGPRASGAFSSLARPGSRSRTPGLYLAGGSVHPGPGVPMATLSGRLAAQQILGDLRSTRRSFPAATSGTTSTS